MATSHQWDHEPTSRWGDVDLPSEADSAKELVREVEVHDQEPGLHLRSVADRYRGRTYLPDPVGWAVVEAILLDAGFPRISGRLWQTLVTRVSSSLHEDPLSLQRLQQIWGRLSCTHE